jgi:diguanylate cyclase
VLNDLFINILLLIAFTFVAGHILKDISEKAINTLYGKILLGVYGGFLGIVLIIYSIHVGGTTTLVDLRVFAIMITSYLGGIIPTIVSGVIIGLYRIVYYGIDISSIIAVLQVLSYIICFYIVDKTIEAEVSKWFFKTSISLIIVISTDFYLLRNVKNVQIILLLFSLVIAFAGILEYILLDYVKNSNELYRRYKKDSTKDFLTGLYNTRQFYNMLNVAFKRVVEVNEKLSCLMIDVDYFKKVNDTYGHSIGDIVLKELALIIKKNCRALDVAGRIGGEEFCVLLFDCPKVQTFEIASRINKAVQAHKFPIGEEKFINITVSIGVAVYPDTTAKLEQLKEEADMALYNAKHSGRNKVCGTDNFIIQ